MGHINIKKKANKLSKIIEEYNGRLFQYNSVFDFCNKGVLLEKDDSLYINEAIAVRTRDFFKIKYNYSNSYKSNYKLNYNLIYAFVSGLIYYWCEPDAKENDTCIYYQGYKKFLVEYTTLNILVPTDILNEELIKREQPGNYINMEGIEEVFNIDKENILKQCKIKGFIE